MGSWSSTYACLSLFFIIFLGFFVIVTSLDVQGTIDCSRQTSLKVDCPAPFGDIEEYIPSVLPFP